MKLFLNKRLKVKANLKKYGVKSFSLLTLLVAIPAKSAFATGKSLDNLLAVSKLQDLQATISGPVLSAISVIMVVVTALMLAFGEWGDGFKRLIQIVFWISIAAGASAMVSNFMS
jgi:type IV secretory pathway VirB2 component (pilin)